LRSRHTTHPLPGDGAYLLKNPNIATQAPEFDRILVKSGVAHEPLDLVQAIQPITSKIVTSLFLNDFIFLHLLNRRAILQARMRLSHRSVFTLHNQ
jgi:hypothetical protein